MPTNPSTAREQSRAMAMAALKPHLSKLAPNQSKTAIIELFQHPAEISPTGSASRGGEKATVL